ncbi:MAG: hypothetical protein SGILL_006406 [Bacillariaceae sp.]
MEASMVGGKDVEVDTKIEVTAGKATVLQPEGVSNDPNTGTATKKSKKRKNKKKKKKSGSDAAGDGSVGGSDVVKQQQQQPDKAEQHNAEKDPHQPTSEANEVVKELPKEKKSVMVGKKETQTVESARPAEIVHSSPSSIEPSSSEANEAPKGQEEAPPVLMTKAPKPKATDPRSSQASPPEKATDSPAAAGPKDSLQQPKEKPSSDDKKLKENSEAPPLVEDDQWETVGARPRDRRKKGPSTANARSSVQGTANAPNSTNQQGGNTKKKNHKRRKAARKFVTGILNSVLDKVEEEVQRKRSLSRDRTRPNAYSAPSLAGWNIGNVNKQPTSSSVKPPQQQKGSTMRDILIGETGKAANVSYSDRAKAKSQKTVKSHGKTSVPSTNGAPADQNTVPTIPETLSGAPRDQKARSEDSSSGDSLEAQKSRSHAPNDDKDTSPSPPLPTLLSPGNNNSSSSSVASSLDAPHDVLPDPKENEVGYHLLGVCKRLSNEIDLFMRRRDDALAVRRHERGLVLSALEETLGGIWPGMCSVEMYGSCATNLDLPSSDLDVVVCGLDRPIELVQSPSNATSSVESTPAGDNSADDKTLEDDAMGRVNSQPEMSQYSSDQQHYSPHQSPMHHNMNMMYPQMSVNAERVMRLTMELEQQPWAVHVKAIPTASVPVIKILADPARLSGAMGTSNEWLVQHRIPAHSAPDSTDGKNSNQSPVAHFAAQEAPPLWRGADVVNGLLKVDITFEGPEHGGIGSTKFSAQAVQDFAAERGVAPEATPAVQALMVLKELLAQRRLNEPFSGGMSSYALLLLVISVIRERSIIREELEKAERQRRVVAAGGGNSALRSPDKNKKPKDQPAKPENGHSKKVSEKTKSFAVAAMESAKKSSFNDVPNNKVKDAKAGKSEAVAKDPKPSNAQSSWANIARKNKEGQTKPLESDKNQEATKASDKELKKPSSFADAVAKGASPQPSGQTAPQQKKQATKGQRHDDTAQQSNKKSQDKGAHTVESEKQLKGEQKGNASVKQVAGEETSDKENPSRGSSPTQSELAGPDPSLFPQGFDDVVEVLCSGETTPGKLLMHFLLFYGQHFDSQSTAIDFSGTHQRDANANLGYSVRSPYLQRRSAGNYDPVTGMLTVDPIVVYDPLIGAESNNVARSCFAWSSIRWVFAQSYMTLSSTVEMNATQANANRSTHKDGPTYGHDKTGNVVVDPNSPLLELLLSF